MEEEARVMEALVDGLVALAATAAAKEAAAAAKGLAVVKATPGRRR